MEGGTSGRYEAAKYASWLFPSAAAKFIQTVNELADTPVSRFDRRPYAKDSVKNMSSVVAEFTTPANSTGLGADRDLQPSQLPINGIAFLDQTYPDWPNVLVVRVRLRPGADRLKAALLRLNRECMEKSTGCSRP
jgi:hypothetical protein